MQFIQAAFVIVMLVTIVDSSRVLFISTEKPAEYARYLPAMKKYLEENQDFQYFSPREVDPIERRNEEGPCKSTTKAVKPFTMGDKAYINGTGNFTFLIVQTEHFEQKVQVTLCDTARDKQKCAEGMGLEKLNMTAECTQRYNSLPFYIYDTDLNIIRHYYAHVPECCLCGVF